MRRLFHFINRAEKRRIIASGAAQTVNCNESLVNESFAIKEGEVLRMANRHNLVGYALEAVARPGARESRVRKPPEGMRIRNERGARHAEQAEE